MNQYRDIRYGTIYRAIANKMIISLFGSDNHSMQSYMQFSVLC